MDRIKIYLNKTIKKEFRNDVHVPICECFVGMPASEHNFENKFYDGNVILE